MSTLGALVLPVNPELAAAWHYPSAPQQANVRVLLPSRQYTLHGTYLLLRLGELCLQSQSTLRPCALANKEPLKTHDALLGTATALALLLCFLVPLLHTQKGKFLS